MRWTAEEEHTLRYFKEAGYSLTWIAKALGLSIGAVTSKAVRLGLHAINPRPNIRHVVNRMPVAPALACFAAIDRIRSSEAA